MPTPHPTDFALTWDLTRNRFLKSYEGLNQAQISYRLFPNTLTIAEMATHVFGVEVSFVSQILKLDLDEFGQRLKSAATDGVVNDKPFPFSAEEMTPEFLQKAEQYALDLCNKIMLNPTIEIRSAELVSALGPVIDGNGAMARMGYHPGYHHAQVYMITQSPEFPPN